MNYARTANEAKNLMDWKNKTCVFKYGKTQWAVFPNGRVWDTWERAMDEALVTTSPSQPTELPQTVG